MSGEHILLINLAILSVRMVLAEWPEGSWGQSVWQQMLAFSFAHQTLKGQCWHWWTCLQIPCFPRKTLPTEDAVICWLPQLIMAHWPERKHAKPFALLFETFLLELWAPSGLYYYCQSLGKEGLCSWGGCEWLSAWGDAAIHHAGWDRKAWLESGRWN